MNNLHYHIALSFIPGVGANIAKTLISYCGSAEAIFRQPKSHLLKIPGIGKKLVHAIQQTKTLQMAEKEMAFVDKNKVRVLLYSDKSYPQRLKHCSDAPLLLYQKGDLSLNAPRIIAVVGTRKATNYGKQFLHQLLKEMQQDNVVIVSGMALGIDGCAHTKALDNGLGSIGILGHGLQTIYPHQHRNLAKRMLAEGGSLLAECNSQEPMVPGNFPRRNRVIAGMSDAVLVVESDVKGGSIITAELANSYNRDVFALPGRYKDSYSRGCNALIKNHIAQLVENAADIRYYLGWENTTSKPKVVQRELQINLNANEEKIVSLLREKDSLPEDILSASSSIKRSELANILLELELKGIILSLPGNAYCLN